METKKKPITLLFLNSHLYSSNSDLLRLRHGSL